MCFGIGLSSFCLKKEKEKESEILITYRYLDGIIKEAQ